MSALSVVISICASIFASTGFWSFLQQRKEKKDVRTQMLIGLGHDRIMYLGEQYLKRGYILRSEYENLNTYLYEPYLKMGGNGTAKHLMEQVNKLEVRGDSI